MNVGFLAQGTFYLLVSLLLMSCATRQVESVRKLWPVPPDTPRLEFAGTIASEKDMLEHENAFKTFIEKIVGVVDDETRLPSPQGVHVSGSRVYVSDSLLKNIMIVDFSAKTIAPLFSDSPLEYPVGLEDDDEGHLYVVDGTKKAVVVFTPGGRLLREISAPEILERPEYIAISEKQRRIYVSDPVLHHIVVFDFSGEYLFHFGHFGEEAGAFITPHGMAIDELGRVFVADTGNSRIQVFDPDGQYLYGFGRKGSRVVDFQSPYDLDFDSQGHLYILDRDLFAMFVYTVEGQVLLAVGGQMSGGDMGFATLSSIHIDNDDRIIISDLRNQRINVWQYLSEEYLTQHPITEEDLEKLKTYIKEQQKRLEEVAEEKGAA